MKALFFLRFSKADMRYSFAAIMLTFAVPAYAQTVPSPVFNAVTANSLTVGGKAVAPGTGIGNVLGPMINYQGSGLPGLNPGSRLIFARSPTHANDFSDFQIVRGTSFTGGDATNINSALTVQTTMGAGDGSNEWNALLQCSSNSTVKGNCIGGFMQGNRLAGSNSPTWGGIMSAGDLTDSASSTLGGALLGAEIDVAANKADDSPNASTFGGVGARRLVQFNAVRKTTTDTTPYEVSVGLWFTANTGAGTDPYTYYDSIMGAATNVQARSYLDARGLIPPTGVTNPVSTVVMSAGQVIDFNGGASLTSAPGRYLSWVTADSALEYFVSGTKEISLADNGDIISGGRIVIGSGTQNASGTGCSIVGGQSNTCTNLYSVVGGNTNIMSGVNSAAFGNANTVTGNQSFAVGGSHSITGTYSSAPGGFKSSDRGRYGGRLQSSGSFAVQGDAQKSSYILRGTGNSTTAIRLTSDGAAAGAANCVNIPANGAYSIVVTIMALDHTNGANWETWQNWGMVLKRDATTAVVVTPAATPTPLTAGTITGSAISVAADTTNTCLNLSFSPPTSNTDTWNVVANAVAIEVQ